MYRYLRLAAILIGVSVLFSCVFGSKLSLAETDADLDNGKRVYVAECSVCHDKAIEGAHRLTNKKRWQESAHKGYELLVQNTITGYRGKYGEKPVMGNCNQCSIQDIEDATAFMLVESGMMK